jgi:hypothetical protein
MAATAATTAATTRTGPTPRPEGLSRGSPGSVASGPHRGEVWYADSVDPRPEGSNPRVDWLDRRDVVKRHLRDARCSHEELSRGLLLSLPLRSPTRERHQIFLGLSRGFSCLGRDELADRDDGRPRRTLGQAAEHNLDQITSRDVRRGREARGQEQAGRQQARVDRVRPDEFAQTSSPRRVRGMFQPTLLSTVISDGYDLGTCLRKSLRVQSLSRS